MINQSSLLLRRSVRCLKSFAPVHRVHFSSEYDKSDRELQKMYEGFAPRFSSLQILLSDTGRKEFSDLVTEGILFPPFGLTTFADLQNPLLRKYKFDAFDFLTGAKEAFRQIHKALASRDFFNYVNGYSKDSESGDLLKISLLPKIYNLCVDAIALAHKPYKTDGVSMFMTDVKVVNASLYSVRTKIVDKPISVSVSPLRDLLSTLEQENTAATPKKGDEDSIATDKLEMKSEQAAESSSVGDIKDHKEESSHDEDPLVLAKAKHVNVKEYTPDFPSGSVVALATVTFEAEESYISKEKDMTGALVERPLSRLTRHTWTFQACLSGHKEMDWIIVGLF